MKTIKRLFSLLFLYSGLVQGQLTVKGKVEHVSLDGKDSLGNIILSVSSGTPPYNYLWDKGFSPFEKDRSNAGRNTSYQVTVKSTGTTTASPDSVKFVYGIGYKVQWGFFNGTENANDVLQKKGTPVGSPTARSINLLRPNVDGWTELVLDTQVGSYMVGFLDSASVAGPGTYFDIDFGFQITGTNALYGYFAGSFTYLGTAGAGDVIRVERKGSKFYLHKNGISLYDRTAIVNKSLMIKAFIPADKITNLGASFADSTSTLPIRVNGNVDHLKNDGTDISGKLIPTVVGGSTPYTYKWLPGNITSKDQLNASQNSYTLIIKDFKNDSVKYYYSLGYRSDWSNFSKSQLRNDTLLTNGETLPGGTYRAAISDNALKKNTTGWMEWIAKSDNNNYIIGFLDSVHASYYNTYNDIDFGFSINSSNQISSYNGSSFAYLGTVNAGDVIKIERNSTQFLLKKNNSIIASLSVPLWSKKLKLKALFDNGSIANFGCSFAPPLQVDYKTGPVRPEKPNGGYITLSPKGGIPPFTYKWNNTSVAKTLSEINAGVYTATVVDAALDTIKLSITVGGEMRFLPMWNMTLDADGRLLKTDYEKPSMALASSYIPASTNGFYQFGIQDVNTNFCFALNAFDTLIRSQGQAPIKVKETIVSIPRTSLPAKGTSDYNKINFADTVTTGPNANVIQKEFFSDTCTVSCSRLTISGIQYDYGTVYTLTDGVTIQKGTSVSSSSVIKISRTGSVFSAVIDGIPVISASIGGGPVIGVLSGGGPRVHPTGTGVSGPINNDVNPSTFEGCQTCTGDLTRNFSEQMLYDDQTVVKSSRIYTDYLGRTLQIQEKNITEKNILATQILYDAYGREVGTSLPAPINLNCFCYKTGFIKNASNTDYTYNDFDVRNYTASSSLISSGEVDNPKPVNSSYPGTLGWYYGQSNSIEKYNPIANTPYARVQYSHVDPSSIYKVSKPGNKLNSGGGHETYNFNMATMGELNYLFGPGLGWRVDAFTDFAATDPCANILVPVPMINTSPSSMKSISRDENGVETVTFTDLTGNTIATCLAGQVNGDNVKNQTIKSWLSFTDETKNYIDIHVPEGCENSVSFSPHQPNLGNGAVTYNVINLKTGELVTFSGSTNLAHMYNTTLQPTLPAGYYRITVVSVSQTYVNANNQSGIQAGVVITQNLNYYNFALYYYDYANRLKARVSPKGFDYNFTFSNTTVYGNVYVPMRSVVYAGNVPNYYPVGKTWSLNNTTFVSSAALNYGSLPANGSKNLGLKVTFDGIAAPGLGNDPSVTYSDSRVTQNTTSQASNDYSCFRMDSVKRRTLIPLDTVIVSKVDVNFKVKIALLDGSGHTVDNSTRESFDLKCTVSFRKDSSFYYTWQPAVFTYEQQFINSGGFTVAPTWSQVKILEINPTGPSLGNLWTSYENVIKDIVFSYNTYEATPHYTPEHKMVDRYRYNAWSELLSTVSPDEGRIDYVYGKSGKVRFTQNAKEDAVDSDPLKRRYSYVYYDYYDRSLNNGEFVPLPTTIGNRYFFQNYEENAANPTPSFPGVTVHDISETSSFEYTNLNGMIPNGIDQVNMVYDRFDPAFFSETNLNPLIYEPHHLAGMLAYSYNDQKKSWYSYDEQGRVEWVVQKYFNVNPSGIGSDVIKTFNYKYDYLGNTIEEAYNKENTTDKFYHYYEYDQDKRVKRAYTSRDGAVKTQQTKYDYYLHGPVKRIELADKLQAIDLVYTVNGWLKVMNGPEMDGLRDPGKDGYLTSGFTNTAYKDIFGLGLEYYLNDYERDATYIQSYDDSQNAALFASDLFNGTIKGMRWQTRTPSGFTGLSYPSQQLMYGFEYDKKYQLKDAEFATITQNSSQNMSAWDPNPPYPLVLTTSIKTDYRVHNMQYDDNGNLTSLTRKSYNANPNGIFMDNLSYTYESCTNKLTKVTDAVATNPYNTLGFKPGQSNNNYVYNALGELTGDASNTKNYEYNSAGNIINIKDGSNNLVATYNYDESGFRIKKTTYLASNMKKYTWYVRDISGNIITVFEKTSTANNINYGAPTEWNVDGGTGRIGILDNTGGNENYIYELSDHLSNVRATFKKQNKTVLTTNFNGGGSDDNWFNNNGGLNNSLDVTGVNYSIKTQYSTNPDGAGTKMIPVKNGNSLTLSWKTLYPTGTTPLAGMVIKLTDAAGNTLPNTQQYVPMAGTVNNWQTVTLPISITANYPEMYLQMSTRNQDPLNKIAWFDDLTITFNSGGVNAPDQLNMATYYPHGSVMPGLNFNSSYAYKYGYQGAFAEMDNESNENAFRLRNYDPLLSRFKTSDPHEQYHSPYLAMGNNHPNGIDADGGNFTAGVIKGLIGAAIGVGVGVVAYGIYDLAEKGDGHGEINHSLGEYAVAAGVGAFVVGVSTGIYYGANYDAKKTRYNKYGKYHWEKHAKLPKVPAPTPTGPSKGFSAGWRYQNVIIFDILKGTPKWSKPWDVNFPDLSDDGSGGNHFYLFKKIPPSNPAFYNLMGPSSTHEGNVEHVYFGRRWRYFECPDDKLPTRKVKRTKNWLD